MLVTLRGLRVNSITTSTALNIQVTSMKEMTNKYIALRLLNKFPLTQNKKVERTVRGNCILILEYVGSRSNKRFTLHAATEFHQKSGLFITKLTN